MRTCTRFHFPNSMHWHLQQDVQQTARRLAERRLPRSVQKHWQWQSDKLLRNLWNWDSHNLFTTFFRNLHEEPNLTPQRFLSNREAPHVASIAHKPASLCLPCKTLFSTTRNARNQPPANTSPPTRNPCVQPLASPRNRQDVPQTEGLLRHLISAKTPLTEDTSTSTTT